MEKLRRKKLVRRFLWFFLFFFLLMNFVTYLHAYRFTHFSSPSEIRTSYSLTTLQKVQTLFTGVKNPRPENKILPSLPYESIKIKSNKLLDCWLIKVNSA